MKYKVISIDIAKNVFQVCALDHQHHVRFNKKVSRAKLLDTLRQLTCDYVVMEACYSSNPWGRSIQALGHDVKLIPPYQVKPFVVGNKNDHNDAIAIAEASLRPTARFVPIKTLEQQDIQSLDRIRERLLRQRTAVSNQLRGLLSEYGIAVAKGPHKLSQAIPLILEDASNGLTTTARQCVHELRDEINAFNTSITRVEDEAQALLKEHPSYALLQTVRGIGPVTAAALIASVHSGKQFKNGRSMAAWIGLTPSQYSSGDKNVMGGITKRGNAHLRKLLIHGARAVMNGCEKKDDKLSLWINRLSSRKPPCQVIVAVANKLARMAWAVLVKQEPFAPEMASR
jgi:transposase